MNGQSFSRSEVQRFHDYPMGPHLRSYLGISATDYRGDQRSGRSAAEAADLTTVLALYRSSQEAPFLDGSGLIDLLDELISMDLPRATLDMARSASEGAAAALKSDFRAQLALGVAAMLTDDLAESEQHLRQAQALMPSEPAPYVNLVQIFLSQDKLAEAEVWCLAGLDAEVNHFALWDLLATITHEQEGDFMPDKLLALAEKRCSWAGMSLAANLITTGDRYLKGNLLEKLYQQGERDPQFLVELTGAYGAASSFDKIPQVVWQAERSSSKALPWQLHVHAAQAQLALGQAQEALTHVTKAERDPHLPDAAKDPISELRQEAADLLKESTQQQLH